MKKTIFFLAALVLGTMAASINAQTLSSSTVDVRYCFTTFGEETVEELCNTQYVWAGGAKGDTIIKASGNYTRTLVNAHGCDSIATLHLTLEDHRTSKFHGDTTICVGKPFIFNGCTLAASPKIGQHYYYAYSTNAAGCRHTDSFRATVQECIPEGAIAKAVFTVGEGKQVYFSQGNVRWDNDISAYRFFNQETAPSSGDEFNAPTTNWSEMAISNGGNEAGIWRLLTLDEMNYLVNTRPNAAAKIGTAIVRLGPTDMKGFIILPDNWTQPQYTSFTAGMEANNVYTSYDWPKMSQAGAIFFVGQHDYSDKIPPPYWLSGSGQTYVRLVYNKSTSTRNLIITQSAIGYKGYIRLVSDK